MNGAFRWGDVGVITAVVVNIVIGTWEIAHLDGRQEAFAQSQLRDEAAIAALQLANSAKDIHLSQVDDAVTDIKNSLTTILSTLDRVDVNTGGDQNTPPNFMHHK